MSVLNSSVKYKGTGVGVDAGLEVNVIVTVTGADAV